MKTTLLALLLLSASAAFGQTASVISNEPSPIHISGHQLFASQQSLQTEQTLLFSSGSNVSAQGERPLWEAGAKPAPEVPLGDIARFYRGQHATARKAVKSLDR
jgi:hypothetical protein